MSKVGASVEAVRHCFPDGSGGSSGSGKGKASNSFGWVFWRALRRGNFFLIDLVDVTWSPETWGVCSHLYKLQCILREVFPASFCFCILSPRTLMTVV